MIRRDVVLLHSEAVATLCIHVQFGRLLSSRPPLVQVNAFRRESELIIGRSRNEHRRCVGWNGNILGYFSARIDGGDEGGPAFRRVIEGNSGSDPSASGMKAPMATTGSSFSSSRISEAFMRSARRA